MPSSKPRSPIRVVMKAFLAAAAAAGLSYQKPISRYEVSPTTSQHINKQQQAIGDQQAEHCPGKQGEEAKEAGKVFVVVHVATL